MARECCPRAFDAVFKLDLYGVLESDELTKVFDFPFSREEVDVHATVVPLPRFDVVLEMIWVFVGWSCGPCAVVAVVRSSSMVVVCFSEPLMRRMSSAYLRLERFVLGSCSASLTPWLHLIHISAIGFVMYCRSELNKNVLTGYQRSRGGPKE